jgi:acyl-CoA synthetase (NDP forming)/ribosomal protein S18 acetylase RimI-like enzyme
MAEGVGGEASSGAAVAATWEADVLLRDGRPVHVRPIAPADAAALRDFHAGLSEATVYFRFFAPKPTLSDADVAYFTEVDHRSRVALVAIDAGALVGVGRYDVLPDGTAEVAFVVGDDLQGQGLGSILLEHLVAIGREAGVPTFTAEVLPANTRMLETFRAAGFVVEQRREDDVLVVSFPIEATERSQAVMADRERRAEARSVARLMAPRTVAVVGAGRAGDRLGNRVLANLRAGGFTGTLVALHPEAAEIDGVRCVRDLGGVDLAVVVVPAEAVPEVIAAAPGVHGFVVVSGGFGDAGDEGVARQHDLVRTLRRHGMRLVGPNALGVINTDPAIRLNASLVADMPPAGRLGFFSQSGALGGPVLRRLAERGLGVSSFVSAGNRADISGNDLLQYWADDPRTEVVLLHLETIGNARKFARIIADVARRKPVLMVRAGGAGQRHPSGHVVVPTDLPQAAVDDVLRACGVIVCDGLDALLDVAMVVDGQPLPRSDRVAVIGNSDALAVMAVNALAMAGLSIAGDPQVFDRTAAPASFGAAVSRACADAEVGAVLVLHVPPAEHPHDAPVRRAAVEAAAAQRDVPVLGVFPAESEVATGLPRFEDVEQAVAALAQARRLARWRARTRATVRTPAVPGEWAPGTRVGREAAALLGLGDVQVGAGAALGWRVRAGHDPVYGPLVSVAVDDPVAEALGDRSYRLAPVPWEETADMLDELRAGDVALAAVPTPRREAVRDGVRRAIVACGDAAAGRPEEVTVEIRHLGDGDPASADLTARHVSVTVAGLVGAPEPMARRL